MNAISSRNNFLPEVSLSRGVPRGHVCNKVGRFHGFRLPPSFADNFERKVKPPVFFVLHGFPSRDNHSRIISLIAHVVVTLSLFKFARLPYSVSFFLHDRNKEREREKRGIFTISRSRLREISSDRDPPTALSRLSYKGNYYYYYYYVGRMSMGRLISRGSEDTRPTHASLLRADDD